MSKWLALVPKDFVGPIEADVAFTLDRDLVDERPHVVETTTTSWRRDGETKGDAVWTRYVTVGRDFLGNPFYAGGLFIAPAWPESLVVGRMTGNLIHAFLMASRPMWAWTGRDHAFGSILRVDRLPGDDFVAWARVVLG